MWRKNERVWKNKGRNILLAVICREKVVFNFICSMSKIQLSDLGFKADFIFLEVFFFKNKGICAFHKRKCRENKGVWGGIEYRMHLEMSFKKAKTEHIRDGDIRIGM